VIWQRIKDRTSFYEWKRRFQTQGFEGLKDLPTIHKSHPQTTPPETVEKIKALALKHPAYGCNRHEAMLALEGIRVSSITIQKILHEHDLGTKIDRWLVLEAQNAEKAIEITPEQAAFLEKLNPCFRERHVESSCHQIDFGRRKTKGSDHLPMGIRAKKLQENVIDLAQEGCIVQTNRERSERSRLLSVWHEDHVQPPIRILLNEAAMRSANARIFRRPARPSPQPDNRTGFEGDKPDRPKPSH